MASWVPGFLATAAAYGLIATLLLLGALRLAGAKAAFRYWPVTWAALSFVFMTQHPFPDPTTLACPAESGIPQLRPFAFLDAYRALWARGAPLSDWVTNHMVAASGMNFAVCALVGVLLSRHLRSFPAAVASGFALSLSIEVSQLTGIFGLYPCAYRQFNVDDLMLNTSGVAAGFLAGRLLRRAIARQGA
jgi:hypothetical protein